MTNLLLLSIYVLLFISFSPRVSSYPTESNSLLQATSSTSFSPEFFNEAQDMEDEFPEMIEMSEPPPEGIVPIANFFETSNNVKKSRLRSTSMATTTTTIADEVTDLFATSDQPKGEFTTASLQDEVDRILGKMSAEEENKQKRNRRRRYSDDEEEYEDEEEDDEDNGDSGDNGDTGRYSNRDRGRYYEDYGEPRATRTFYSSSADNNKNQQTTQTSETYNVEPSGTVVKSAEETEQAQEAEVGAYVPAKETETQEEEKAPEKGYSVDEVSGQTVYSSGEVVVGEPTQTTEGNTTTTTEETSTGVSASGEPVTTETTTTEESTTTTQEPATTGEGTTSTSSEATSTETANTQEANTAETGTTAGESVTEGQTSETAAITSGETGTTETTAPAGEAASSESGSNTAVTTETAKEVTTSTEEPAGVKEETTTSETSNVAVVSEPAETTPAGTETTTTEPAASSGSVETTTVSTETTTEEPTVSAGSVEVTPASTETTVEEQPASTGSVVSPVSEETTAETASTQEAAAATTGAEANSNNAASDQAAAPAETTTTTEETTASGNGASTSAETTSTETSQGETKTTETTTTTETSNTGASTETGTGTETASTQESNGNESNGESESATAGNTSTSTETPAAATPTTTTTVTSTTETTPKVEHTNTMGHHGVSSSSPAVTGSGSEGTLAVSHESGHPNEEALAVLHMLVSPQCDIDGHSDGNNLLCAMDLEEVETFVEQPLQKSTEDSPLEIRENIEKAPENIAISAESLEDSTTGLSDTGKLRKGPITSEINFEEANKILGSSNMNEKGKDTLKSGEDIILVQSGGGKEDNAFQKVPAMIISIGVLIIVILVLRLVFMYEKDPKPELFDEESEAFSVVR